MSAEERDVARGWDRPADLERDPAVIPDPADVDIPEELEDEIREFECLGACDMAPMASVDGRYVGPLDPGDAKEIVAAIKEDRTVLPGRGLEDADYRLPWGGRA